MNQQSSATGFDQTVDLVRTLLGEVEMGVISEIDIKANLKEALDVDIDPYLILGACAPKLAHQGLQARPDLGALLPCNICVHLDDDGGVLVSAMEPKAILNGIDNDVVQALSADVSGRLVKVLAGVATRSEEIAARAGRAAESADESGEEGGEEPAEEGGEDGHRDEGWSESGWPPALQEIIDEFLDAGGQMDRYELLYEYAEQLDLLPQSEWTEESRVHGCQSEAHIAATLDENGRFYLRGASDAQIVQGLISITAMALNGLTLQQVVDFSPDFVKDMGVAGALTPSRANGFLNMFARVKQIAHSILRSV